MFPWLIAPAGMPQGISPGRAVNGAATRRAEWRHVQSQGANGDDPLSIRTASSRQRTGRMRRRIVMFFRYTPQPARSWEAGAFVTRIAVFAPER
jgi:hypothetical protein